MLSEIIIIIVAIIKINLIKLNFMMIFHAVFNLQKKMAALDKDNLLNFIQ